MVKKETIKGIGSRIKSMDLFGPRVQLRLNNKKEFKTTLGGTFTLILFIATSLVGFYYLLQLTARSTPSIQFKEKLLEQIDMEEVKEELLVHLIGVVNKESGQMLSNGFSVTLTISRTNKKVSIFELEKCQNNSSEFKDIQEHVLQKGNEYSNYYCLSQKDFQNANLLQLDPTSVINYQLQLEYSLLAEKGDNLEVINISKDSFLDPTQYENPFQPYFCINMISLNQYYFDIQFSSRMLFIEVRSSNGYFLKEISSISSIQLEDSQETQTNSILRFQRDMNQGHTIQMTYSFNQKKQIQVVRQKLIIEQQEQLDRQ